MPFSSCTQRDASSTVARVINPNPRDLSDYSTVDMSSDVFIVNCRNTHALVIYNHNFLNPSKAAKLSLKVAFGGSNAQPEYTQYTGRVGVLVKGKVSAMLPDPWKMLPAYCRRVPRFGWGW